MACGYCAGLNPKIAKKGRSYAKKFIREKQGVCLSGAAEIFLGFIGSVSTELSDEVFPILLDAYDDPLPNEMDWILEAFMKIIGKVSTNNQKTILECATEQMEAFKPSTKKRAEKILKSKINKFARGGKNEKNLQELPKLRYAYETRSEKRWYKC